jgi:hypothetical protein
MAGLGSQVRKAAVRDRELQVCRPDRGLQSERKGVRSSGRFVPPITTPSTDGSDHCLACRLSSESSLHCATDRTFTGQP